MTLRPLARHLRAGEGIADVACTQTEGGAAARVRAGPFALRWD